MPEPERTTDVTLGELMHGPAPEDDLTRVTASGFARRSIGPEPEPTLGDAADSGTDDDEGLLEDDDYLLEPSRRWNRLTVALVVALIFLCGFIIGVLAARLAGGQLG